MVDQGAIEPGMKLRVVLLAFLAVIASACGASAVAPAIRATRLVVVPLASVQHQVAGKPVVYLFPAPVVRSRLKPILDDVGP
jgi:hypothetical protein